MTAITIGIDCMIPTRKKPDGTRVIAFSATEHGFPLGYIMKPGDKVILKADRSDVKDLPQGEQTVLECGIFRMMHIDERTDKAAQGWIFSIEELNASK